MKVATLTKYKGLDTIGSWKLQFEDYQDFKEFVVKHIPDFFTDIMVRVFGGQLTDFESTIMGRHPRFTFSIFIYHNNER